MTENSTLSSSLKTNPEVQKNLIFLFRYNVNLDAGLLQDGYEPTGNVEALRESPNRVHKNKKPERHERELHAIALLEPVFDNDGYYITSRFVSMNSACECIGADTKKPAPGKMVNEIWPGTDADWIGAYSRLAQSGSPSHFDMCHSQTSKRYRCHLFGFPETEKHFFVIFKDTINQQTDPQSMSPEGKTP
ncbi:MAG: hypothetical protein P4L42_13275 [Desulfocapsaceae bacterium]|nr:hypothetical protein [Desulfocapsaceae bacterium]